jgi:hypothetical protein
MIGIVFILIFLTGFLLSRIGRPYSNGTLTVHKLLGLTSLALFVLTAIRILRTGLQHTEIIPGAILTVLFFLGLIVTGGLVSALPAPPKIASAIHKIFPYLTVLSTGVTLYFLT